MNIFHAIVKNIQFFPAIPAEAFNPLDTKDLIFGRSAIFQKPKSFPDQILERELLSFSLLPIRFL